MFPLAKQDVYPVDSSDSKSSTPKIANGNMQIKHKVTSEEF